MPIWQPAIPPVLRPHLLSWVGYDFTGPAGIHHGVPSLGVTVVISLADPIDCGWLDRGQRHQLGALVSGLHATPALIRTEERQCGLELSINPLSVSRLVGLPAGELAGCMIDPRALGWPSQLLEEMREATWPRRFQLLETFLIRRLDQPMKAPRADVAEALDLIRRSRGQVRIDALAKHVGLSRRRLSGIFALDVGLSPKQMARITRFQHAQRLLRKGVPAAVVAATAGYGDQPHLSREWKALTGWTLSQSKEDFPLLQDRTALDG